MTFNEHSVVLLLLVLIRSGTYDCTVVNRDSNEDVVKSNQAIYPVHEKTAFDRTEEKNLEQEILRDLNYLSSRKQRQIFAHLEKQQEKFNITFKTLASSEPENLSPLNVEEIKNIQNTMKASNSSLPAIRNKRTLNFLLYVVARALGYTLTPTNPDAEWIQRSQPSPAPPCTSSPRPCTPNPISTPPPCAVSPTPPCPGLGALMQPATIPPNQIDANTISYPYRPARTIPLFNFAPLPIGVRVPYPPLLQSTTHQRSSCPPQQPPPPCGTNPIPTPTTLTPRKPVTPCSATSPPPPCGTIPPPSPPPCKPTPTPSACGTTPAPRPSSCANTPPPPPPCTATASPSPPPCVTTPAPPPPPCGVPLSDPCGNSPSPPPPSPPPSPSEQPKKGSILLEYDDPVRIQIFSNVKKYLPASGSLYSGHDDDDDQKKDFHYLSAPGEKKDDDYEEKEEVEEEHFEEEEEDGASGQLKHYEEEASGRDEEDESETNLSIVKKPAVNDFQKVNQRQSLRTKIPDERDMKNEEGNSSKYDKAETELKMKKPKRKKWVRIVKKQRRKTKTDSSPQNYFQAHSSDSFPESSQIAPKLYEKRDSDLSIDSFGKDVSDTSGDSSSDTSEDVTHTDFKKLVVNNKALHLPDSVVENRRYEFNINPYALEPEEERRQKIEKAVERYIEDYVEKQLGDELVKNTGVPKTTVFEFAPKNGPKIQTITTTVAKTTHPVNPPDWKLQNKANTFSRYKAPTRNVHFSGSYGHRDNFSSPGDNSFEAFATRT